MGDRQAFEELYRRYSAPAFGLAFRVTGQDLLAQEVVHIHGFKMQGHLPPTYPRKMGG